MQANLCKIQELLKDHPTVFKDQALPIYTLKLNFKNADRDNGVTSTRKLV